MRTFCSILMSLTIRGKHGIHYMLVNRQAWGTCYMLVNRHFFLSLFFCDGDQCLHSEALLLIQMNFGRLISWVCGPSLTGIASSSPTRGMGVSSFGCCVLSGRDLPDGLIPLHLQ